MALDIPAPAATSWGEGAIMQTPRACFFDVFGTLVDWRNSIAREAEAIGLRVDVAGRQRFTWLQVLNANIATPLLVFVKRARLSNTLHVGCSRHVSTILAKVNNDALRIEHRRPKSIEDGDAARFPKMVDDTREDGEHSGQCGKQHDPAGQPHAAILPSPGVYGNLSE